jgi:polysaccharide export outer membrane protein
MTTKSTSVLKTLVLAGAAAGVLFAGTPAFAQGPRTAPAPAPRTVVDAPASAATPAARALRAITSPRSWTEEEYRLGPGDKLRIEVYREPQLSQALQVRPDGKITLPLVGDVTAAGTTSLELRDALATALKEYVTNPVVTVIVTDALAAQVYVIGEVSNPGAQVMQGPMTVLQALAQAGGLKEFAKKGDIRVLRKVGPTRTTTLNFNYKDAINGDSDPMPLQPGDTVVVP